MIARGAPPERLGIEEGVPDALNVSVISAADLQRLNSDPFRQDGSASPTPAPETPPSSEEAQKVPEPQQQPAPAPEPVKEASADAVPLPNTATERRPFDPSSFAKMASEQFSAQLTQAVKASEAQHEAKRSAMTAPNLRMLRPGASHVGKSDEFARGVIWALGATKPMGNGKWGSTVVTFVVSPTGQVEGLRLLKTSGDNWLDQGALLGVRQARLPVPPPGLPAGDRSFNVEYISLPDR